jgi:glycine cleavage system regulatory protein
MTDGEFKTISIPASDFELNEELDGIIPKGWIETPSLGKVLFKEAASDRENIAESRTDWSEKVVSEINQLVGLPTALYELAVMLNLYDQPKGLVVESKDRLLDPSSTQTT